MVSEMPEGLAGRPGGTSRAKNCILCTDSVDSVGIMYVGPRGIGDIIPETKPVNKLLVDAGQPIN